MRLRSVGGVQEMPRLPADDLTAADYQIHGGVDLRCHQNAVAGVVFHEAVFHDTVLNDFVGGIGLEVDPRGGSRSSGVLQDAAADAQVACADDADALPVVIVANDAFNQDVPAGAGKAALRGGRVQFPDVVPVRPQIDAVAPAGFDGQVADHDVFTAPEGNGMAPFGGFILFFVLIIGFVHFDDCSVLTADDDILSAVSGHQAVANALESSRAWR